MMTMNRKSHNRLFYLTYTQTKMLSKKKKRPDIIKITIQLLLIFSKKIKEKNEESVQVGLDSSFFHDKPDFYWIRLWVVVNST